MTNKGKYRSLGVLTCGEALLINLRLPTVPWEAKESWGCPASSSPSASVGAG